jgi:hypothetical protein
VGGTGELVQRRFVPPRRTLLNVNWIDRLGRTLPFGAEGFGVVVVAADFTHAEVFEGTVHDSHAEGHENRSNVLDEWRATFFADPALPVDVHADDATLLFERVVRLQADVRVLC